MTDTIREKERQILLARENLRTSALQAQNTLLSNQLALRLKVRDTTASALSLRSLTSKPTEPASKIPPVEEVSEEVYAARRRFIIENPGNHT